MLQISFIRDHRDFILKAFEKRNYNGREILDEILETDRQRRAIQTKLDYTLAEANKYAKEIGQLFKKGEQQKATLLKEKTTVLKENTKGLQHTLHEKTQQLHKLLYQVPNVPHYTVPKGNTHADNIEIIQEGVPPQLSDLAMPHWELAKKYDIIDFDLGAKITGAGFPVYKDKGARLQRALISYFLDENTKAGYIEYQPPHLVNEVSGYGTGQLPDKEGQMYYSNADNLYLIPTAEVPITNLFRDVILNADDLPICCTAYTPCFRREAGSYGAHVRGLNRLHQFDKVEIVRIEHPEDSYKVLETMVAHVKKILNALKLPFRILNLCGGDLGFTAALTYDFEVFSGAQNRWLEVSSVSNFETFQANRLKLRVRDKNGKIQLAHTLNGSALALPRVLACILENYQDDKGINIPEVLIPYTGFDRID